MDLVHFLVYSVRDKLQIKVPNNAYYNDTNDKKIVTQLDIKKRYGLGFMLWGVLIKSHLYKKTLNFYWKIIINYKIIHMEDYQITYFFCMFAKRYQLFIK